MPSDLLLLDLLSQALRALNVRRAFRAPGCALPAVPGIDEVAVPSEAIARALADADGRLSTGGEAGPGVALLPGTRLRLSAQPGAVVPSQPVTEASAMVLGVASWTIGHVHGCTELDLELDLTAPVPHGLEPLELSEVGDQLMALSPSLAEMRTVILAGPGVARADHAGGLAAAADHTGAAVVETFGAVGTLPHGHPARAGVVGLQAGDAQLSGLAEAELVIVAGLDPAEVGVLLDGAGQVLEVEPWHLGLMAARWSEPKARPAPSALVGRLAQLAAQPGVGGPAAPWQVVTEILDVVVPGTLVAADAGPAGWWLTRGLVPCRSRVVAPALASPGFAVAAAFVAGLDGWPGLAVSAETLDPTAGELIDLAGRLELPVVLLRDDPGGEAVTPSGLHDALTAALAGGTHHVAHDLGLQATDALEALAGPCVAWPDVG